MNQSCNFYVHLDLESLEPYIPTLFCKERQKNRYFGRYQQLQIWLQTYKQTDRRTWQLYDRPGPEGRVGEEEKNLLLKLMELNISNLN